CSVIIKPLLGLIDFYSVSFFTGDQKNRIHIIPLCTETDLNLLSRVRFCGSPVIFRAVAEHGVLVENRAHIQDILHFFRDIFFFTLHKNSPFPLKHMLILTYILQRYNTNSVFGQKKGSRMAAFLRRRYFFLWGVAKTI